MPYILYHYTTSVALERILEEARLLPSTTSRNPRDVRYGEGIYLTDVEPGTISPPKLCAKLIGSPFAWRKFTHYVAIDVEDLNVSQGRPGIYVIRRDEPLEIVGRIIGFGPCPSVTH